MRCTSARRTMLLYREGELTPSRAKSLAEHCASCAECARIAQRVEKEFASVDALRRRQPALVEPQALTMSIMRGIEISRKPVAHLKSPRGTLGRFLILARRAGGVAVAAMLVSYAALSTRDARTVASLERRIGAYARGEGENAVQLAREATALLEARNDAPYARSGIDPGDVGRMLEFLVAPGESKARVTIEDVLLRKYPGLASVTLQDGLDDRERTILADEGARFLNDLEKLIRKEKGIHGK